MSAQKLIDEYRYLWTEKTQISFCYKQLCMGIKTWLFQALEQYYAQISCSSGAFLKKKQKNF